MYWTPPTAEERFPVDTLDEAQKLLSVYIDQAMRVQPFTMAVFSLGAGGDMIFAAEILKRGISLTVFLPFEKDKFITSSVDYLKGGHISALALMRPDEK